VSRESELSFVTSTKSTNVTQFQNANEPTGRKGPGRYEVRATELLERENISQNETLAISKDDPYTPPIHPMILHDIIQNRCHLLYRTSANQLSIDVILGSEGVSWNSKCWFQLTFRRTKRLGCIKTGEPTSTSLRFHTAK
jgi:hypothetical protein